MKSVLTLLVILLLFYINLYSTPPQVVLGNEIFLKDLLPEIKNKKLGLVINHTSLLPNGTPLLQALLERRALVRAIFSPEHGYSGLEEGGIQIKNSSRHNINIYSLYGQNKKPTPAQMKEIDVFIYDIQDVGTRFYTYITTLKYVIMAASEAHLPVYVLDRPNPIGGEIIEGPRLQVKFKSFIGAFPIPVRHGLTCGELSLMMKGEGWVSPEIDLRVVKMENWKRKYFWEDTQLNWIPTSPNMPSPETACAYPGTGLLGGIILNQGLGTPEPFLRWGAPWMEPYKIEKALPKAALRGITLEKITYTPIPIPGKTLQPPYKNQPCRGFKIHILQKNAFFSLRFTLALIKVLKELYPEKIYQSSQSLTLMFGNDLLAKYLQGTITYPALLDSISRDESQFREQRHPYLLYK